MPGARRAFGLLRSAYDVDMTDEDEEFIGDGDGNEEEDDGYDYVYNTWAHECVECKNPDCQKVIITKRNVGPFFVPRSGIPVVLPEMSDPGKQLCLRCGETHTYYLKDVRHTD
jgi:hypothetical protein